MKLKLFLSALILSSFLDVRSQVYKAGTIFPGYYDAVPDTSLDIITSCSNTAMGCEETYSLTMFGGSTPNVFIYSHYSIIALGGQYRFFRITPLDPNISIYYGRTSTCCYGTVQVAKPLSLNDSVNSLTAIWKTTNLDLNNTGGNMYGSNTITDFVSPNDLYIGVKFQNVTDLEYGWIRVNAPNSNKLIIKDYSWTNSPLGINGIKSSPENIYPNPFTNELFIENSEYEKIQLFDCLSREVNFSIETIGNKMKLNIGSELPKGIYYLKISGKNGAFSKKFIKS